MPTTLYYRNFLGKKLVNGTPGTTQATDAMGRSVASGTTDYMGRQLVALKWVLSTVTALGATTQAATGELLVCTTAGTTSAGTTPTAPGFGLTRTDGTVPWTQVSTT